MAARAIDNLKRYRRSVLPGVRTDLRAISRSQRRKVDPLNLAQPEFVRRRRWKRLLQIRARRNRDAGVRDNFRVAKGVHGPARNGVWRLGEVLCSCLGGDARRTAFLFVISFAFESAGSWWGQVS